MQSNSLFKETMTQNTKDINENIFYTVGLPILVQKYNSYPRLRISDDEMIESFSQAKLGHKKLRLFKTEEEASHYAHMLREGFGFGGGVKPLIDCVYQPAVFKVSYIGEHPLMVSSLKKETMTIPAVNYINPISKAEMEVNYYEIDRLNVFPLEAQLKLRDCGDNGMHVYPKYSYIETEKAQCKLL